MVEPEQRGTVTFQKKGTIPQASIHNVGLYLFKTSYFHGTYPICSSQKFCGYYHYLYLIVNNLKLVLINMLAHSDQASKQQNLAMDSGPLTPNSFFSLLHQKKEHQHLEILC